RSFPLELRDGIGRGELQRPVIISEHKQSLADRHSFDRAYKMAPVRRSTELTIGDRLETGLLLKCYHFTNRAVHHLIEVRTRKLSFDQRSVRAGQFGRTQQASDMIGAKRRGDLNVCHKRPPRTGSRTQSTPASLMSKAGNHFPKPDVPASPESSPRLSGP